MRNRVSSGLVRLLHCALALMALPVTAQGVEPGNPWLASEAWAPAEITAPELVGSVADEFMGYRRALHRDVLEALESGELTDAGRAEALRLLAILRPYDRRSVGHVLDALDLELPAPDEFVISPTRIDRFEVRPGPHAATIIGLPMLQPALDRLAALPPPESEGLLACAWQVGALAAAPRFDEPLLDTMGMIGEDGELFLPRPLTGPETPWAYGLRRTPTPLPGATLLEVLNSDDPSVRVSIAAELIRRQCEAEQWIAEALAQGDPTAPGWTLRRNGGGGALPRYIETFVEQWPDGREPPGLSEQGRLELISVLGEVRTMVGALHLQLTKELTLIPDDWPHPVPPAGFALARIGQTVVKKLYASASRTHLDIVGLIYGEQAAEAFAQIVPEFRRPPTYEEDLAYLRTRYQGSQGMWTHIPDEPPGAP
ncbi:MAG: hypothetical protein GF320_12535 [Armatimonadia bacterium]|nr:hypothetical protein [Armatimonadia bacterium]